MTTIGQLSAFIQQRLRNEAISARYADLGYADA